jgi:hypothetical protein
MLHQLKIPCLKVSSQNAFHFILSLSDRFCKSWRWYGLKWTLCINTFHTVGSGIWSSLLACTADFHGLLMNASQMWSTVSTVTCGQPVLLTLADKPFIYKLPIPTSRLFWLWAIHCQTLFWNINDLSSLILSCETTSNIVAFAPVTLFSFDSYQSTTRGWYVTINAANTNVWVSLLLSSSFMLVSVTISQIH